MAEDFERFAADIRRRQAAHLPVQHGGARIVPRFVSLPNRGTYEHMRDVGKLAAYVEILCAPEWWEAEGMNVKGKSVEEVKRSLHTIRTSLPELFGSVKQVAWATSIREQYLQRHPEDTAARTHTMAAWWIQNRVKLLG